MRVTEWIYIAGLLSLATGVGLQFGFAWALMATGATLLVTAFRNAAERDSDKGQA